MIRTTRAGFNICGLRRESASKHVIEMKSISRSHANHVLYSVKPIVASEDFYEDALRARFAGEARARTGPKSVVPAAMKRTIELELGKGINRSRATA